MSDIEKMLDDLCSNMRKGLPVGAPRAAIVAEFERLTKERDAWMDTAATHLTNETFYLDIVQSIGALFPSCYVSDDGSVQDEPLALKVKECVVRELESDKALLAQRAFSKLCRNCRVSWFMPQVDRVADEPDRLC